MAHSHYKSPHIIITLSLFVAALASLLIYHYTYANEVYPRVRIGSLDVGGQTKSEAADTLDKKIDEEIGQGFKFIYKNKTVLINPVIIAPEDPDLTYTLIYFDTERMAREAFSFGHSGNLLLNLGNTLKSLVAGKELPVYYTLNDKEFLNTLRVNFKEFESPAKNANLVYSGGKFTVTTEQSGQRLLFDKAIQELRNQINNLDFQPIELELTFHEPEVTKVTGETFRTEAEKILAIAPLKLTYNKKSWAASRELLASWLTLEGNGGKVSLTLNGSKIDEFLNNVAREVDVLARDAKFRLENGRVVEFQASRDGERLNKEAIFTNLIKLLFEDKKNEIPLVVELAPPLITTANVNNLGIKELIGKAATSFAGSPKNRKFNIGVGVEKLNGLLIIPGEEFSLIKSLGEISEETGYKSELVIKGDKTIPEFGGGLCQIGTTVFRAALNSGLPILERRNHSYRVPYYEPPVGLDATIYNPAPDLKFKNDTDGYILIQARVDGNALSFEFWGLRDGRTAEIGDPVVYNRVPPPPKQVIETEDLPPGKEKCTERAHEGADAKFTYKVAYSDGRVEEKVFRSHYRPWAEVCLVGKKKVDSVPATTQ